MSNAETLFSADHFFDQSPKEAVNKIAADIEAVMKHAGEVGVSANCIYLMLQFYCHNVMTDIQRQTIINQSRQAQGLPPLNTPVDQSNEQPSV